MKQPKFKLLAAGAALGLTLLFGAMGGSRVNALFEGSTDQACQGIQSGGTAAVSTVPDCDNAGESTVNGVLKVALNIFSLIVGVIAVIMIVFGGLKFILSKGDPSNISLARNTIIYAVVGIVIVALAQFIVRFVLTKTANSPTPITAPVPPPPVDPCGPGAPPTVAC